MAFVENIIKGAAAVAVAFSMSACATDGVQLEGPSALPQSLKKQGLDVEHCVIINEKGLSKSLFFPLSYQLIDNTKTDLDCWGAKIANILLDEPNLKLQAAAVGYYDIVGDQYKRMIDDSLKLRGKTMEDIRSQLPQITAVKKEDDGCIVIFYKPPANKAGMHRSCEAAVPTLNP